MAPHPHAGVGGELGREECVELWVAGGGLRIDELGERVELLVRGDRIVLDLVGIGPSGQADAIAALDLFR